MKFFLFLLLLPLAEAKEKRTVCTITMNSSEERETFEKKLPKDKFEFVELTKFSTATNPTDRGEEWFKPACDAGIHCDVLVVSGHFGGNFFGKTGFSLSTNSLEVNSCNNSCAGILAEPKEVFLFGCNTLAEKTKDMRTPEQYLQVLLADNISRPNAERIVEARYGALGDSFRDRMRRIFAGIPHLYGFDSVGPSGENVKPYLERYFKTVPDYEKHLEKIEAEAVVAKVENANKILRPANQSLAKALKDTAFHQCSGIDPSDSAYSLKEEICRLHSPNLSLGEKMDVIAKMLRSPDRLLFLPSVSAFVQKNNSASQDPDANSRLLEIKNDTALKAAIDELQGSLRLSPILQLDVMRLKLFVGWLNRDEFNEVVKQKIAAPLKNLNRENIDLICSLTTEMNVEFFVELKDFQPEQLRTPLGAQVFGCVKTKDEAITAEVIKNFKNAKPEDRAALLSSVFSLPGYKKEILAYARTALADDSSIDSIIAKSLLLTSSDETEEKEQILINSIQEKDIFLVAYASQAKLKSERVAKKILEAPVGGAFTEQILANSFYYVAPRNAEMANLFLQKSGGSKEWRAAFITSVFDSDALRELSVPDWVLTELEANESAAVPLGRFIAEGKLSDAQITALVALEQKIPSSLRAAFIRSRLRQEKDRVDAATYARILLLPHMKCASDGKECEQVP